MTNVGYLRIVKLRRGGFVIGVIWGIISMLLILWFIGLMIHVGGALIHLLLVVALVLLIVNLITGRKAQAG
jgi:hypothetical protein